MQNYHNIQIVDASEYSASKYILRKVEVSEFLLTVIRSVESRDRLHGICIQEGWYLFEFSVYKGTKTKQNTWIFV
jgi:hypothetical protein